MQDTRSRARGALLTALSALVLTASVATGNAAAAAPATAVTAAAPAAPRLDVRAAALMDADTGQLLYGDNAQQPRAIASTTKLMTALVALEHGSLDAVFTEPNFYFPPIDSQIGLAPGERMSVHDLLLALLLPSADDAAADLAYNIGHGSTARFVAMMNARARSLGLLHTHYSTPSGLDTPGNYSTAADLVELARYDLNTHPWFRHAVALPRAVLRSGNHPRVIVNRNDLVARYPWIHGVKTGHTLQAGYVLVAAGTRDGMTLISAVLGTPSESERDATTMALLNWGFGSFRLRTPVRAGGVIARPHVRYRPAERALVIAASTYAHVFRRGAVLTARAHVPAQLAGPLARGARVGTLVVRAGGQVVARVPLVLARALPRVPPPGPSLARLAVPITLVVVLLLGCLAVMASGFGRQRRRGRAAEGRRPR